MNAKTMLVVLAALGMVACAGNPASSRNRFSANMCPAGSVKVCTSLFELSKERYPNCGCSELISSR